jgi:hypothetical protein
MRDYLKERKREFEKNLDNVNKALTGLNCMEGNTFNVNDNNIYDKLKNDITIPLISLSEIYFNTKGYNNDFIVKIPMFLTYKYLLDLKEYFENEITKINNGEFKTPEDSENKIHKETATPELYHIYKKDRDKIKRTIKLNNIFKKDSD